MAPHIDMWTNDKTINGDKDVSIGGMHSFGTLLKLSSPGQRFTASTVLKYCCYFCYHSTHSHTPV